MNNKQDILVSGSNIKTINNESVLGAGNISLPTQQQSDWNQTDNTAVDYIKNKPIIPDTSNFVQTTEANSANEATVNSLYNLNERLGSAEFSIKTIPTELQAQIDKASASTDAQFEDIDNEFKTSALILNKIKDPIILEYGQNIGQDLIEKIVESPGKVYLQLWRGDPEVFGSYKYYVPLARINGPYVGATGHTLLFLDLSMALRNGNYTAKGVQCLARENSEYPSSWVTGDLDYLRSQQQADWNETDNTSAAYIKNKPGIINPIYYGNIKMGYEPHTQSNYTVMTKNGIKSQAIYGDNLYYGINPEIYEEFNLDKVSSGNTEAHYSYNGYNEDARVINKVYIGTSNDFQYIYNDEWEEVDTWPSWVTRWQDPQTQLYPYNVYKTYSSSYGNIYKTKNGDTDFDDIFIENPTNYSNIIATLIVESYDGHYVNVKTEINKKQDTLVSGTNIKTVNGTSLLGSGDITVGGGFIKVGNGLVNYNSTGYDTNLGARALILGEGTGVLYTIKASGYNSFAHGERTQATGGNSHAEGFSSKASGQASHAEGSNTTAGASASHAEGFGTTANNEFEHASGRYNIYNSSIGYFGGSSSLNLFDIGNGDGNNARHNAFEVRQNGDIYYSDTEKIDGSTVHYYDAPMRKLQDAMVTSTTNGLKVETASSAPSGTVPVTLAFDSTTNTLYIVQ